MSACVPAGAADVATWSWPIDLARYDRNPTLRAAGRAALEAIMRGRGDGTRVGEPLRPNAKEHQIAALRAYFRDWQDRGWIPRRFDPTRYLRTPRALRALTGPDPRISTDDVWAKLLWAGLNLQPEDIPGRRLPRGYDRYPLEMVRALVVTWLFAGLRADELSRLRVGCVRWQHDDATTPSDPAQTPRKSAVCWLDVPVNKTHRAFTKAVDHVIGEAITT